MEWTTMKNRIANIGFEIVDHKWTNISNQNYQLVDQILGEPDFLEKVHSAGIAAFQIAKWVKDVHDYQTKYKTQINASSQLTQRIKEKEDVLNKLSWM